MKAGVSIAELAQEIERQQAAKRDYVAPAQVMRLDWNDDDELALRLGDDLEVPDIKDLAHRQIGEFTGIPAKYYDRMKAEKPELLAANVNHWLAASDKRRMVRTLDNNVRAFLS